MTKQELAKGLMPYVLKAFISPENIHTGFLTRQRVNPLAPEQVQAFSIETENIINKMVELYAEVFPGDIPSDYNCGVLFQYVFDKTTEALFKLLTGQDVDTQFILKEAFEFHAPDLPEYIQLKLTNVVGNIAAINQSILHFIDENDARTSDVSSWMPAYLMVSVIIAIQFAQEIDPDDDSEMQAYLNS